MVLFGPWIKAGLPFLRASQRINHRDSDWGRMKKRIGFVGLGIMGRPMSENLVKAGFELTVYNRSMRPSVGQLAAMGAKVGASPRQVAQDSDVVIVMVTDTPDVEAVILVANGVIEGVGRGTTVIDMSTISPSVTRKIAERLSRVGASMLDAPVSGGEKGAKEGTLTIMVGGPQDGHTMSVCPYSRRWGRR